MGILDKLKSSGNENDIKRILKQIECFFLVVTGILFLGTIIVFWNNIGFGALNVIALFSAYYFGGCCLGFIFAIPKSSQANQSFKVVKRDAQLPASSDTNPNDNQIFLNYKDNTNLEEISDWITKIIVGLSLTQFGEIQKLLAFASWDIAKAFNDAVNNDQLDFYVFAYSAILFYFIGGLIIGYLWTRIDFPKILTQAREDTKDILTKDQLKQISKSIKPTSNDLYGLKNLLNSNELRSRDINDSSNPIIKESEDYNNFRSDLEDIIKSTTVRDKEDPQKNRWGGQARANKRVLSAVVETYIKIPGLYKVKVSVKSENDSILDGFVAILLHDSFKPDFVILDGRQKHEVTLELISYEAFTIAAILDFKDKTSFTQLELDLNTVPGYPAGYYWK